MAPLVTRRGFLAQSAALAGGAAFFPAAAAQRRPQDYISQSMYEHWETFIRMLAERGFTDQDIGMIVGGNFLRVMRAVLPA